LELYLDNSSLVGSQILSGEKKCVSCSPPPSFRLNVNTGFIADGVELVIMIVGTFAQATAAEGRTINILVILIFWRFIVGFLSFTCQIIHRLALSQVGLGVGGDYPLSATIASEFAPTRHRGRMMTAVFSAQGWGTLGDSFLHLSPLVLIRLSAASIVATIITIAYKGRISEDFPNPSTSTSPLNDVDRMWRLFLGLGCIPGTIALYFRLTIPETPRFTMDIERNVARATADIHGALNTKNGGHDPYAVTQRADAPRATRRDFLNFFGRRGNLLMLFCTCWSWFAIDVGIPRFEDPAKGSFRF
jgi:PHS family inorganic phosphate transporter-like MFS transporter